MGNLISNPVFLKKNQRDSWVNYQETETFHISWHSELECSMLSLSFYCSDFTFKRVTHYSQTCQWVSMYQENALGYSKVHQQKWRTALLISGFVQSFLRSSMWLSKSTKES